MISERIWLEILDEFRQLGGRAENVRLGEGPRGRGLFPIDPSQPVDLHVPENLLFPADEMKLQDGTLRIADSTKRSTREGGWFERYAAELSWGAGGQQQVEEFVLGMQTLPLVARIELAKNWGLEFCLVPMNDQVLLDYYLQSRVIAYPFSAQRISSQGTSIPENLDKSSVIMPMIELANHGPEANFNTELGISLTGTFSEEVLVSYGRQDPWGLFRGWGICNESFWAVSRRITLQTEFGPLTVTRDLQKGRVLETPQIGQLWIPQISIKENEATISFVTIGRQNLPRTPRAVFQKLFHEAKLPKADETFDRIRQANFLSFLELLELLEDTEGPQARSLRKMVRFQLKAMAYCHGTRDL